MQKNNHISILLSVFFILQLTSPRCKFPICRWLYYTIIGCFWEQMNCKLAGQEQLAAQGVSGRQVLKGVAGGSQRRGSVASPVMIDRSRNAAGNHPLSAGSPRQGATHYLQVVYSCALFQRGRPRAAALEAIMTVLGLALFSWNVTFPSSPVPWLRQACAGWNCPDSG